MQSSLADRLRTAPHLIRDVDGDGLMLTVEPLQFLPMPEGRTAGGAESQPPLSTAFGANVSEIPHNGSDM